MTMFIIFAIVFGVLIGGFLGLMFTINSRGWKKVIGMVITIIVTGCLISGMFCLERKGDVEKWNNGKCGKCGSEWVFANADHVRNGGTRYFWKCDNCKTIIELHSQME